MAKKKNTEKGEKKSLKREIWGLLLLCIALLMLLSLVSHDPADWPGSSRAGDEPSSNLVGRYGAFLSHFVLQGIGISGYFLTAFLLIASVIIIRHLSLKQLIKPLIIMIVLGLFVPLLLTLLLEIGAESTVPSADTSFGGILGALLYNLMFTYLGRMGAILLSLTIVLVAVALGTSLRPSTMLEYLMAFGGWLFVSLKSFIPEREAAPKKKTRRKTTEVTDDDEEEPEEIPVPEQPEDEPLSADDGDPFLTPLDEESDDTLEPDSDTAEDEPEEDEYIEPEILSTHISPYQNGTDGEQDAGEEVSADEEDDIDDYTVENDEDEAAFREEEEAGLPMPDETEAVDTVPVREYVLPPSTLLEEPRFDVPMESREELIEQSKRLVESLRHFNIESEVKQITPGPIVTRYELKLAPGVKVGRVVNLSDDLQLALRAKGGIRILAPIPGKALIGIEVPNQNRLTVYFKEIVESAAFKDSELPLVLAIGKNTSGEPIVADLARMPHLLIAGSTGAGKSVCINTLISSVLMKATPEQVRMIMIDPKVVELSIYNKIPHLLSPVVTDPRHAANALKWAVKEMETRYRQLAAFGVRDILQYNAKTAKIAEEKGPDADPREKPGQLPYIVVIIDEFADLMVVAGNEVEEFIARLAQMARAVGIHLVLATQRPSSDVITGLIKANFPSRIAFKVMQASNSRIILDTSGADKLLGLGDMLFLQVGKPEPVRLHGAYISNDECTAIADFAADQKLKDLPSIPEEVFEDDESGGDDNALGMRDPDARDALFYKAARLVVRTNQGSVSLLQRRLKVGYARAARLIDQLEMGGVVGPYDGSKAREVLVDELYIDELENGEL